MVWSNLVIFLHRFSLAAKFGVGEVTQPEAQYVQSAERLCCGLPVDMHFWACQMELHTLH